MFFDNKSAVVGEIRAAMLTETQFQQQASSDWVLADGRSASGTRYNALTGAANIPDLRGQFLRGKDNGAGINPDGDTALGTAQSDSLESHLHTVDSVTSTAGGGSSGLIYHQSNSTITTRNTSSTGSTETRPVNITVNFFIKIN